MTRYKLNIPQPGTVLQGDEDAIVATSVGEARTLWLGLTGVVEPFWTQYRGSCRVLYARDIAAGDCHDGADPGDTTIDYLEPRADGTLRDHEVLVFVPGVEPLRGWRQDWRAPRFSRLKVGTEVHHPVFGRGVLTARRRVDFRGVIVGPIQGMTVPYSSRERAFSVDGEELFSAGDERAFCALMQLHAASRRWGREAALWPEFEAWMKSHPEVTCEH